MIARVADHCLWFGRYLERAENTARHVQVTGTLSLDAELPRIRCWHPLLIVSGQEADYIARVGEKDLGNAEKVQQYLLRDLDNPVSLVRSVAGARENARSIREVVSLEVWQTINALHVFLASEEATQLYEGARDELLTHVHRSTQLALGLLRSTMLHDAPLDFIWLGVLLERVSQTARLLDVEHHALELDLKSTSAPHPVLATALWLSLLRACSGYEAFMKRNRGKVTGAAVAAFLILEPRFPRSVRYCLTASRERLVALCEDGELAGGVARARLLAIESWLSAITPEQLAEAPIHDVLTRVVSEVHAAADAVASELFGTRIVSSSQSQSQ